MSRSGYSDDFSGNEWSLICYRGAVSSATKGKRGQALLVEMLAALDAMPVKELVPDALEANGQYCALGVVGAARGVSLSALNPEDDEAVAKAFNIAPALAKEIAFVNDDDFYFEGDETPEQRWRRVRKWVAGQIVKPEPEAH